MNTLITILGPTASGKTRLAALIADKLNGEVISADSRQVYRSMNLGTGKDYNDYQVEDRIVPYHLVDILEPGEEYNVFQFQQDFFRVHKEITDRNKIAVFCGGTGLYLESVLANYKLQEAPHDETLRAFLAGKTQEELVTYLKSLKPVHNTTDILDRDRTTRAIEIANYEMENDAALKQNPTLKSLIIGIAYERNNLRERITQRLSQRLEDGMVAEVENLVKQGIGHDKLDYYGLEYRYISRYLSGMISYEEMFSQLNTSIHQFAKRQMTWFRRMERKSFNIHWLPGEMSMDEKLGAVVELYKSE